ncbi:hypothetical protein BGX28_001472 [Mortierella sp. GBA30]|nr:hypothetical protein BGX28_001472 [Mortierella sp. GBA30]
MAAFLAGVILIQLVFYFRPTLEVIFSHSPSLYPYFRHSDSNYHHPSVPLTLKAYSILDELAEAIVRTETYRVFSETGQSSIHGTLVQNNPKKVKMIRDQIDCWTQHGAWVRQEEKESEIQSNDKTSGTAQSFLSSSWATRRHMGDPRFGVCDIRFVEALDRLESDIAGEQHVLGEFDRRHGRWMVREAVKYRWVPDESVCGPATSGSGQDKATVALEGLGEAGSTYLPFDKEKFCETIGKRHLLIVGDLTQYQLHDVLLSATGTPFNCHGEHGCLASSAPHVLCENTSNLTYARNDIISVPWAVAHELDEYPDGSTVEQAWATPELLETHQVVLLNRGLFWRTDDEFLQQLMFTMKHLWKNYPDIMILYRATHAVSNNCTAIKDEGEDGAIVGGGADGESVVPGTILHLPLNTPPERIQATDPKKTEYRPTLADVQRQNRMARAVVEAAGGIFLDTENMFAMRPDGRMGDGDCARFCAPGPLDVYSDLVYNTLRILKT